MKKLLIFLLTLFLLLVSCGNGNDSETIVPESTDGVTELENEVAPESSIPDGYKVTKFVPGVYHAFDEELGIYTYPSAEVRKSETEKLNGLTLEFLVPEEWWTYDDVNAMSTVTDYFEYRSGDDGSERAYRTIQINGIYALNPELSFDENFHGLTLIGRDKTDFPDGVKPMYDPIPLKSFQDGNSIHTGITANGYEYVAYGSKELPFIVYIKVDERYVICLTVIIEDDNGGVEKYNALLNSLNIKM